MKYKIYIRVLLVQFLSVLSGCAGRDFVRPNPELFKLGQTTYEQVVRQMGEPFDAKDAQKNGKNVKLISYVWTDTTGDPAQKGVIPSRSLAFSFYNDTLVGESFNSSFKSDSTNFDEKKIVSIVKGKTTRAEVIQLLGRPSASYVPPIVKEVTQKAIGYNYHTSSKHGVKWAYFIKKLTVTYDDKEVITDVIYEDSFTNRK